MRIRRQQIDAFGPAAEAAFVTRVIEHLAQEHPDAVLAVSPERLREQVERAIAKGRRYGFTWESSLVGFVVITLEVGPDFDRHPAFQRALGFQHPDENERIIAIFDSITDEDWAEARQGAEPRGGTTSAPRAHPGEQPVNHGGA